jgi:hypothetical protein
MFRRLLGIGVAFTILSSAVTAWALDWSEYSWVEGGVAILMPGAPEKSEQALANGGKLFSVAVSLGATYYSVSVSGIDKGLLAKNSAEQLLEMSQNGSISAAKGTLRTKRPIKLGATEGREFVYDTTSNLTLKQRQYIFGDRLLQVVYVGPPNSEGQPEITRYFDSLRFIKP